MASGMLQYLSSDALDITSQTCLLTVGFGFLSHCLAGEEWKDIVMEYGFLVALLAVGRSAFYCYNMLSPSGASTTNAAKSADFISSYSQHVTGMVTLGGAFVLMSLTNRYGLIATAYLVIGYTSTSLLRDSATPLSSKYGVGSDFECHNLSWNRGMQGTAAFPPFLSEANNNGLQPKNDAKLSMYIFSVSALLSGLLFSEDKLVSKPAFRPFSSICTACFILSAMYIATNQRLFHRRASAVGRAVSSIIYMCTVAFNGISVLLMPILDYFPSLRFWDDLPTHPTDRAVNLRADVGEKDLLLDLFNKLTGESDGRPIEIYNGPIPSTFVIMCSGNEADARVAFSKCLQWRQTYSVSKLIDTPQHDFFEILQMSPHAIHGMSLDGCQIIYECLNKCQNRELQRRGLTPEKLIRHYMMRNEFIFRRLYNNQDLLEIATEGYKGVSAYPHLQPGFNGGPSGAGGGKGSGQHALPPGATFDYKDGEEWQRRGGVFTYCPQRLMTIVDVKDISASDITTDAISFMRQSGEIMDKYYPEIVERLVIVNAPSWFWTIWRMVSRVLPESVQKKVQIFNDINGLDKFIAKDQRPVEYGGTDPRKLGESDEHKAWLSMADVWEANTGVHILRFHEIEEANARAAAEAAKPRSRTRTRSSGLLRTRSASLVTANDTSKLAATNSSSTKGTEEQKSGWAGWWRARFGGSSVAYMADENRYFFDPETKRWTQETQEEEHDEEESLLDDRSGWLEPGPRMSDYQHKGRIPEPGLRDQLKSSQYSQEKLEEHGLVLAIQAAHVASNMGRSTVSSPRASSKYSNRGNNGALSGLPGSTGMNSPGRSKSRISTNTSGDSESTYSAPFGTATGSAFGSEITIQYPSLHEYFEHQALSKVSYLCCSLFFLSGTILSGLICAIPVWLMSPASIGGKGYSVLDLAVVFACAGLLALQGHVQFRWRLRRVAQVSPVRALRISAGALTFFLLLLSSIGSEAEWFGVAKSAFKPASTMLAVPLPAVLLLLTAWAAQYLRQAAECLYLLSRQRLRDFESSHSSSDEMTAEATGDITEPEFDLQPYLVATLAEILGPLVFSWLLVFTHGWALPYPMDSGFFIVTCACVTCLFYAISLLLALQFVGDFGFIPDDPVHAAGIGALGDIYLLLGRSAQSSASTFVGARLFTLNLKITTEVKEV